MNKVRVLGNGEVIREVPCTSKQAVFLWGKLLEVYAGEYDAYKKEGVSLQVEMRNTKGEVVRRGDVLGKDVWHTQEV
ncbi:MAG: hypothetical protein OYG31_03335 [Candidatus Kaiserbacteria bacterium]|nr:hypothetical protein [Candidatus Kaiserbacteria bacterium]